METDKGKGKTKRNMVVKTWERCKSVGRVQKSSASFAAMRKSKSWGSIADAAFKFSQEEDKKAKRPPKRRVIPEKDTLAVYVGPEKQRFMIKTKYVNHPLFKILLEEAELVYGFDYGGPLVLPCKVDSFRMVLSAIDGCGCGCGPRRRQYGCRSDKGCSAYHLLMDLNVPQTIPV